VYLLHPGSPTGEERLHAALLYAGRQSADSDGGARSGAAADSPYGGVMITGLAALALHGFSCTPSLPALDIIDVLVPRTRRLRSEGCVRLIRTHTLPRPGWAGGVPVAPVGRALADAVADATDAGTVGLLLTEAVREGHCEPAALVRELNQARLLRRAPVEQAVDSLLAGERSLAEDRLYDMVRGYGLPEPAWNVDLRLPGGPHLAGVDAYWPEQAVAVDLDTRTPRRSDGPYDEVLLSEYARKREHLERFGITVVHVTPRKLRESPEQQATVVRAALLTADEREPAVCVAVLPR
jgi:hypothetical protein